MADHVVQLVRARMGRLLTGATPVQREAYSKHEQALRRALESLPVGTWEQLDTAAFAAEVARQFFEAAVRPGENVGILAAMAIGEKQTQLTLNSFHSAGIACTTVVSGVARLAELMNITPNPKATVAHLPVVPQFASPRELRDAVGDMLVCTRLGDIAQSFTVDTVTGTEPLVRIELDPAQMYLRRASLSTTAEALAAAFAPDEVTVASPGLLHAPQLEVAVSTRVIAAAAAMLPGADTAVLCRHTLESVVVPALARVVVAGIPGIHECFVQQGPAGDRWALQTRGSNLHELLHMGSPLFDACGATSNDVLEICECLGIEAARRFLADEFSKVINADGTDVDRRHVLLVVDSMTRTGTLVSISRYGLRGKASVFARSSFEETADNIMRAAAFAETDNMASVSSNIMAARRTRVGTGACDLMFDMSQPSPAQAQQCASGPSADMVPSLLAAPAMLSIELLQKRFEAVHVNTTV